MKQHLPGGVFGDVKPKHSRRQSAVRGRGNKSTEMRMRFALVRAGVRGWTMNPKEVPGRPDFFFPLERVAVFVDGCFWHGCLACGHYPKKNSAFWRAKIERNRERDQQTSQKLRDAGYTVLRFWEHELREDLAGRVRRVAAALSQGRRS